VRGAGGGFREEGSSLYPRVWVVDWLTCEWIVELISLSNEAISTS
jgi:hypothetical protein